MRKSQILLGAVAALSMGFYSCTSEDAPEISGGNEAQEGSKYMAVNIRTAGMTGTRAAGEGFEEGTGAEGTVTVANTRFYFFDGNNKPFTMVGNGNINAAENGVASNMVQPQDVKPGNTDGNTTAGEAVLILGTPTVDFQGMLPAKAICVVGLDANAFNALQGQDLATVATNLSDYKQGTSFIMTTSNWEGAGVQGAVNIADKVKDSQAAAEAAPADFYLDRLAVRVEFKESTDNTNTNKWQFPSLDKDGNVVKYKIYKNGSQVEVGLNVVIDKWQIVNKANNSYLVKQLPTTAPWENWSDASYHRSYWAVSPVLGTNTSLSGKYDISTADNWLDMKEKDYANEYTQGGESITLTDIHANTTAVAIKAHVEYSDGTPANIVSWAKNYYTLDDFKALVVSAYNKDDKTTETITEDDVILVDEGTSKNSYKVQVKGVDYRYKAVEHWNNGVTSFYMNITNNKKFGVVRNHIYQYEIEKVIGLGNPGNGDRPEPQESYVAARLNVLNWKVVSNKVTLE